MASSHITRSENPHVSSRPIIWYLRIFGGTPESVRSRRVIPDEGEAAADGLNIPNPVHPLTAESSRSSYPTYTVRPPSPHFSIGTLRNAPSEMTNPPTSARGGRKPMSPAPANYCEADRLRGSRPAR